MLSGVNRGANTGRAVMHSGTVGAALTAGSNGLRGLAVSLAVPADDAPPQWDTVGAALPAVLAAFLDSSPGTIFNVNIPDVPPDRLGSLVDATLSATGVVQARTGGEAGMASATTVVPGEAEPGSDAFLLAHGAATVTGLRPISDAGGRFGRPPSPG